MYEYQKRIQRIIWDNEDYWSVDNDKESEELQEVYSKAKAWDKLKGLLMEEYPQLIRMWESTHGEGEHAEYCKANEILERMDKLDNTNEFSNLLSDLEDE